MLRSTHWLAVRFSNMSLDVDDLRCIYIILAEISHYTMYFDVIQIVTSTLAATPPIGEETL